MPLTWLKIVRDIFRVQHIADNDITVRCFGGFSVHCHWKDSGHCTVLYTDSGTKMAAMRTCRRSFAILEPWYFMALKMFENYITVLRSMFHSIIGNNKNGFWLLELWKKGSVERPASWLISCHLRLRSILVERKPQNSGSFKEQILNIFQGHMDICSKTRMTKNAPCL